MHERQIRRKDRQISEQEALALLEVAEYGVLGLSGPDGEPYAVPLSFVVLNGVIYFHCAQDGWKIECIRANPKGALTVVGETQPVFAGDFSTYYESAMAFGPIVAGAYEREMHDALYALTSNYLPDYQDKAEAAIAHSFKRTAVYALHPERISGKAKRRRPDSEPKGIA